MRDSSQKITQIWNEHARKIASGEIVRHEGQNIHIDEYIDKDLRREIENFLNAATRALKTGLQNLGRHLKVEIGFLFQQQGSFEKGIAAMEKADSQLAAYLRQTRAWSEPLMKSRIDLEHGSWMLPRVTYTPAAAGVGAGEPSIAGRPVTEFVAFSFDRMICFVEEFTAHCLQQQMPAGTTFTELALADRLAEAPERFRVTLSIGGLPPWRIAFHASKFEDT